MREREAAVARHRRPDIVEAVLRTSLQLSPPIALSQWRSVKSAHVFYKAKYPKKGNSVVYPSRKLRQFLNWLKLADYWYI